jgi:hypothetical protein
MARFGRSAPLMQRPRPLRSLVIADDFTNGNNWNTTFGAPSFGGGEYFGNGPVSPGWGSIQNKGSLDSDDFEIEWIVGQMVGTVNGAEDVSYVGIADASGNGIAAGIGGGGVSNIYVTNGFNPAGNWGTAKASGTAVGAANGDRIAIRRVGNLFTMYKNRSPTNMATWNDTGATAPKGIAVRRPMAFAYNSNGGQARFMGAYMARSLRTLSEFR